MRVKRQFAVSPKEPTGEEQEVPEVPEVPPERECIQPRFVVQEHHASHLHHDCRLEMDGVLRSWAVPKGPPQGSGVRHLAVAVDDHPLSYIDFHGTIPAGQYGAGTVQIWDRGTYDPQVRKAHELRFVLYGALLRGPYTMMRLQSDSKYWLLFKRRPLS